jgi:glycosyltransferase involved in cell wall biosynthesis
MARKRFDWALEVLAHTPRPELRPPLQLVAVGFGGKAREQALAKLPEALQGRVHFAPFLSDAELRALYRSATAVLYPTLYEGFGFPAIEAQASGVPALFSSLGSLGELIGPLAWVLPPQDRDAWVAKVQEALDLPAPTRASLAQAARQWARRFEWQASYAAHLRVYENVVRVA